MVDQFLIAQGAEVRTLLAREVGAPLGLFGLGICVGGQCPGGLLGQARRQFSVLVARFRLVLRQVGMIAHPEAVPHRDGKAR